MKPRCAVVLLCVWVMACDAAPKGVSPVIAPVAAKPSRVVASQIAGAIDPAAHHCEGSPELCQQNAAPPSPQVVAGGNLFGSAIDSTVTPTPLAELLSHPADFADKTVVTAGTIARVCQQRGCWMELRGEAGQGAEEHSVARVPMAGHAFFVPSDSSGRKATVQGKVSVREGTDNPLRIDATAVLIASAD